MDALVGRVAYELGPHGDAAFNPLGQHFGDAQPQHLVEGDLALEHLAQPGDELGLELHGRPEAPEAFVDFSTG